MKQINVLLLLVALTSTLAADDATDAIRAARTALQKGDAAAALQAANKAVANVRLPPNRSAAYPHRNLPTSAPHVPAANTRPQLSKSIPNVRSDRMALPATVGIMRSSIEEA